jgi:ABC-2 type transport system permease protein
MPGYLAATWGTIALGLLFGSLAFAVGAGTGRRSLALTVASAVAVATYTLNGLAGSVKAAHGLRFLSPFHWFLGRNMLAQGIAPEGLTLPIAFAAVFAVVGIWRFLRRDLRSG